MTITVRGPNNISIEFPDGTDPQTIDGVMRQAMSSGAPEQPLRERLSEISRNPIKPDDRGVGDALVQGGRQGVSFGFSDELRAGVQAALQPIMGTGYKGDSFSERYGRNVARERGDLMSARENHPVATIGGELGGVVLSAPVTGSINAVRGAGLGARIANGAVQGAAMGGLYGLGTGEGGVLERLPGGATGAAMGALGGAATPAVVAGIGRGARAVATPFRTAFKPEQEAARRVGTALTRDGSSPQRAEQMLRGAQQTGTPLVVADAGGEVTRAAARSAANTSPEARQALETVVNNRQNTQLDRTETFIKGLVGRASAHQTTQDLQNAARLANGPAYAKAYSAGSAVWDQTLQDLTTAPAVQDAIRRATRTGANSATGAGFRPPVNPFVSDGAGGITLRKSADGTVAIPNLQFWDHVQRNLSDAYDIAVRKGANSEARDINILRQNLVSHLDQAVPEFGQARAGAARFFGAQDALEAGQVAVTTRADNAAIRQGVGAMNSAERQLFQEGFATELISRVREGGNRSDVANSIFLKSPAARERIEIALGPHRAMALEAFIRTENIMTMLKRSVQGNSTTARQIAEMGLAGGIGGSVINGGFDPTSASWWTSALMSGLALKGVKAGSTRINQRVARRVGELLASNDPEALNRAAQQIAVNPRLLEALRYVEASVGRGVAPIPSMGGVPAAVAGDDQPR